MEVSQVSRGLRLVQKQVHEKHQKYISSSSKMTNVVAVFTQIASKMEFILDANIQKLISTDSSVGEDTEQEKQSILSEAARNLNELKSYFRSDGLLGKIQANGLSESKETRRSSGTQTKTSSLASSSPAEESVVQVYERILCSNHATINKAMVGGPESWVISSIASLNESEMPYIEIILPQPVHLSALTIQGGIAPKEMQPSHQSPPHSETPQSSHQKLFLPCGLGLDDCDGSIENTVKLLADVISWETLIKKNSPEKFLARPPVRFLFDLINYVTRVSSLPVYQSPEETSWETVGLSKDTKMAFVDKVLTLSPAHSHSLSCFLDSQFCFQFTENSFPDILRSDHFRK